MQIPFFSLFMSVLWSSALAIFNYFCRKKHFFIRHLGITNVLFLYLFSIARMIIPYNFSFSRAIPSPEVFDHLYKNAYANKTGSAPLSTFCILAAVWAGVSAVLILKFIFQYHKSMTKFSTYSIWDGAQCRRVFGRVLNTSRREIRLSIRRSEDIQIPMGAGIFQKSIILPNQPYSDRELYAILRHEYTHFQNRDLLIKMLIHIYRCIFWWNPILYLLERDLAQMMEIKCDLDVTGHMKNQEKAGYLATIVAVLKQAEPKRPGNAFFTTTAFVARNYESEIIERFQIVSTNRGKQKRNLLFTGSWFLAFCMLIFLSCSFVIRPVYAMPIHGTTAGQKASETAAGHLYRIRCVDGIYHVYFREQPAK